MKADPIERALQDVSDGKPLEWSQMVGSGVDEAEREQLKWLLVLEQIADLYRSIHDSPDAVDRSTMSESGPTDDLRVRQDTWGRYQLLEKVGEGGFGSVHRAWDPQLDCELAIKILHQRATDHRSTERLLDEGRALAKVRHSNVVRVLGIESHEDRVGLCMDFVRGQSLDDLVREQGPLSAAEATLVGRDVCAALAAVHRAGFVHRDVKAGNVMREQAGRIVLMDFGAGRELGADLQGRQRDLIGTPLYMAPELLAGESASPRTDVYSVGVLLYYLVTTEYPFQTNLLDELKNAHREGRRQFLIERRPDLPGPFVRVVEKALAADPKHRHPSAGAFLEALGTVFGAEEKETTSVADGLLPLPFIGLVGAGVSASVACALGALSSVSFNHSLGLAGFASENLWDFTVWGFKSTLLPASLVASAIVLGWLFASLIYVVRRFLASRSSRVANRDFALPWNLDRFRLVFRDVEMVSSLVLWLSVTSLAVSWWYFWPLIRACLEPTSQAPAERLALLGPASLPIHDLYRTLLTGLVVVVALSWYLVMKLASRQGRRIRRGTVVAGAVVLAFALGTLDFPYRLLRHSAFEATTWSGRECYITGEREADFLLFCPELQPPRNRVVAKNAGGIERLGQRESIFTRFSPKR